MEKEIVFKEHAQNRLLQRSEYFGITYEEAVELVIATIKRGKTSKKHTSKGHATYCCYSNKNYNISCYVVCKNKIIKHCLICEVQTVIFEKGRK